MVSFKNQVKQVMADTGGDSEDSPSRVPQEWEVISGSMSGLCVPSSFLAGAPMDGSTFLMASDMNTAGGGSSGVDFSLLHSQHFMVPSAEQLDENLSLRAGSGTKACQSPGASVSDPHDTSQVEDPAEGRGSAEGAPQPCEKDWIDPASIHLASTPGGVPVGPYRAASLTLSESSLGSGFNSGWDGGPEISYPLEGLGPSSVPFSPAVAGSVASVASHSGVKDGHALGKGAAELNVDHAEEVEGEPTFVLQEGQGKVPLDRTIQGCHTDDGADLVPAKEVDATEDVPVLLDEKTCVLKSDVQYTCDAWWKRRVAQCFVQARQANTLWSIALAAAVMGLVILGQRWQRERYQNQQLRLQLCSRDDVRGSSVSWCKVECWFVSHTCLSAWAVVMCCPAQSLVHGVNGGSCGGERRDSSYVADDWFCATGVGNNMLWHTVVLVNEGYLMHVGRLVSLCFTSSWVPISLLRFLNRRSLELICGLTIQRISRLLHQVKELSERRRIRLSRPTSYGGLLN